MENPKEDFKEYLLQQGFSDNTLLSYLSAVYQFLQLYGQVTSENLISYRTIFIGTFSPLHRQYAHLRHQPLSGLIWKKPSLAGTASRKLPV